MLIAGPSFPQPGENPPTAPGLLAFDLALPFVFPNLDDIHRRRYRQRGTTEDGSCFPRSPVGQNSIKSIFRRQPESPRSTPRVECRETANLRRPPGGVNSTTVVQMGQTGTSPKGQPGRYLCPPRAPHKPARRPLFAQPTRFARARGRVQPANYPQRTHRKCRKRRPACGRSGLKERKRRGQVSRLGASIARAVSFSED
jgi:hypothetical protein